MIYKYVEACPQNGHWTKPIWLSLSEVRSNYVLHYDNIKSPTGRSLCYDHKRLEHPAQQVIINCSTCSNGHVELQIERVYNPNLESYKIISYTDPYHRYFIDLG